MIFLTQLVYVYPGKESTFHAFEDVAIPLIAKHHGELLLRVRPNAESIVESRSEPPYEIHIVRFERDEDFARFAQDPERQGALHLKSESVRSALLIKGAAT